MAELVSLLLLLAVLTLWLVVPVVALVRAGKARRRADEALGRSIALAGRVAELEREIRRAREEGAAPVATPPEAAVAPPAQPETERPAAAPPVAAEVPVTAMASAATKAESFPTIPPPEEPQRVPPPQTPEAPAALNWEQFLGVKLFAWAAGLALFLGVGFFLKWSFDRGWITPPVRVAMGFAAGLGLLVGGLRLPRPRYAATVQSLTAAGVLILYADVFASFAFYHFINGAAAFILMGLVTATAFLLALRLDAPAVAILGLLGGFLAPPLLSTGQDRPFALFGYIALLDCGLLAVVLRRRWSYLSLLAAIATVIMQFGWYAKFFAVDKIYTAMVVFLFFALLFTAAALLGAARASAAERFQPASALLMSGSAFLFVLLLIVTPYRSVCERPWLLFGFLFAVDLTVFAMAAIRREWRAAHPIAGGLVFLLLALWSQEFLSLQLLNWTLGFVLVFALVHSIVPVVIERRHPGYTPAWWSHLFVPAALLLVLIPIGSLSPLSAAVWPAILLLDILAVALAAVTLSLLSILAALLLTGLVTIAWILRLPSVAADVSETLLIIGGFAALFFLAGVWLARQVGRSAAQPGGSAPAAGGPPAWLKRTIPPELAWQLIPATSALLPFLLLTLMTLRLPLGDPSPVFGLAALMILPLLALVIFYDADWVCAAALAGVLLLQYAWHLRPVDRPQAFALLAWHLAFYALFAAFPFFFGRRLRDRLIPWAAAALAAPAHFHLAYLVIRAHFMNPFLGLIPAAFAAPSLSSLVLLLKRLPPGSARQKARLALFGGTALLFITLIFPVQFERQWITIGWALEGAALLWLLRRVPHVGLKYAGAGLLLAAFARLALNPDALYYQARSGTPIFNWYLYSYGLVTLCLFLGARLLAPPRNRIGQFNAPPVLAGLGTLLAFLLLNIEIADAFSTGERLVLEFTGNFARDMTYSLGWGVFAFVMLLAGIMKKLPAARYGGLSLLVVTLLKLFLHDLWRLGGLYRIGSLIGLALLLLLVSFLYQRFLAPGADRRSKGKEPG